MKINVSYCADHNYAYLLASSIASILINAKEDDNLFFYILDNGLTIEDRDIISSLKKIKEFSILFKKLDMSIFDCCKIETRSKFKTYNNISTYGRLMIANVFNEVDKLLYLDADIIVEKSLRELFSIHLNGKLFGACTDKDSIIQATRLNIFHGSYFNAGVLLIDCMQWRKKNIINKIIDFLKNYKDELNWADQDLLNIMFSHESVYLLDKRYNYPAILNEHLDPTIYHFWVHKRFENQNSYLLKFYIEKTQYKEKLPKIILKSSQNNEKYKIKKYIKYKIKTFLNLILKNKKINRYAFKFSNYYQKNYNFQEKISYEYINGVLNYIFKDRIIKHGLFKGMHYNIDPNKNIFQKLLGSYEKEVQIVMEHLIKLKPKVIINIGTEDGYYAIGMGFKLHTSNVLIYENDNTHITSCYKLARENNILDKVKIYNKYKINEFSEVLHNIIDNPIFICDYRGEEQNLFNRNLFFKFRKSFFIIKIYDSTFYDMGKLLISSFQETHDYKEIYSITDYEKVNKYNYEEISHFDFSEKLLLLSENNDKYKRWFYIYPKNNNTTSYDSDSHTLINETQDDITLLNR